MGVARYTRPHTHIECGWPSATNPHVCGALYVLSCLYCFFVDLCARVNFCQNRTIVAWGPWRQSVRPRESGELEYPQSTSFAGGEFMGFESKQMACPISFRLWVRSCCDVCLASSARLRLGDSWTLLSMVIWCESKSSKHIRAPIIQACSTQ